MDFYDTVLYLSDKSEVDELRSYKLCSSDVTRSHAYKLLLTRLCVICLFYQCVDTAASVFLINVLYKLGSTSFARLL